MGQSYLAFVATDYVGSWMTVRCLAIGCSVVSMSSPDEECLPQRLAPKESSYVRGKGHALAGVGLLIGLATEAEVGDERHTVYWRYRD